MNTTKLQRIREVIEGQALKHPEIDVLNVLEWRPVLLSLIPNGTSPSDSALSWLSENGMAQAQPLIEMGATFVIVFFRLYEPIIAPSHQWSGPSNYNAL